MNKIANESLELTQLNIQKLKKLFPNVVIEGKIDFDMLRTILGDEIDESREKYQFTWSGKSQCIKIAQTPSTATLRPCKKKSKDWDSTENLYIEGDNLEVLKQLQKTYYGKIKMIYIDPPYNTGRDFIYHDNYRNSLANYKKITEQELTSNPESSGRFHTDWLNMMYPRLILSKNLLSSDGVILISIDDNEQTNLKKICDEIFGETNYSGSFIWQKKTGASDAKGLAIITENILVYVKDNNFSNNVFTKNKKSYDMKRYKYTDDFLEERGPYYLDNLDRGGLSYSDALNYGIKCPDGTITYPNGRTSYVNDGWIWKWSKQKIEWARDNKFIEFRKTNKKKSGWAVCYKNYLYVDNENKPIERAAPHKNLISDILNANAASTMKNLFGTNNYFNYSKPVELLMHLIQCINTKNSIILDFFSGSATTAHAVMKLNAEDNGNRKFIMVQLPELCSEKSEAYKAGFKNICDLGEERIRRAGEQIKSEWEKSHPSDGLYASEEKFNVDIGFKVFQLDSTNINEWDSNLILDEKELAARLGEVFKNDRSKEDVLYEIMLKYGVFDRNVEEIEVNGRTMYRVGKRYMIVCLEDNITSEDVKAIGELSPKTVVFKESGFMDDNAKINTTYNLKKAGVEDIKCI